MIEQKIKQIISDFIGSKKELDINEKIAGSLCDAWELLDIIMLIDEEFGIDLMPSKNSDDLTIKDLIDGVNKLTKYADVTLH